VWIAVEENHSTRGNVIKENSSRNNVTDHTKVPVDCNANNNQFDVL
jgi:hypothetical protein